MPATNVGVVGGTDVQFLARQRAVWASLPLSLAESAAQPALVAIDGAATSWPSDLGRAVTAGARGILVVEPTADVAADEVRRATESAPSDVAIIVHREWASHPAVTDLVSSTAGIPEVVALADSIVSLPDVVSWPTVLAAQLALLRVLGVPVTSVDFTVCERGYTVHGQHAAGVVAMAAWPTAVPAPFVRTVLYGADGEVHLDVSSNADAAPARAWLIDTDRATMRPTWYESAARADWRRLSHAVETGDRPDDLAALADDLDTVAQIVEQW